jgi:hypothetical protein
MESVFNLFCNKDIIKKDTSFLIIKRVRFTNIVKLVLIPNRHDLTDIKDKLWWNTSELKENIKDISSVYKKIKLLNPDITINDFIEQIEEEK